MHEASGLAHVLRLADVAPPAPSSRRAAPHLRFRRPDAVPDGAFSANAVPNAGLRSVTVPGRDASWEDVEAFALSYDGYAYWSDVAELGRRTLQRWTRERRLPGSLDELRGCLFTEARRWHGLGREPQGRARVYVGALVEAIARVVHDEERGRSLQAHAG